MSREEFEEKSRDVLELYKKKSSDYIEKMLTSERRGYDATSDEERAINAEFKEALRKLRKYYDESKIMHRETA